MKIKKVSDYQKEYDTMKRIAEISIENDVPLSSEFAKELFLLTKLLKSMGGKV